MSDFNGKIRELGPVPAEMLNALKRKLQDSIRDNSDFWDSHDSKKPNKYTVFKEATQHIVFSFPTSLKSHEESCTFPIWQDWQSTLQPIIDHTTRFYGFKRGRSTRIMLAKLKPGGVIPKHIDLDKASKVPHKIHVPIFTNAHVEFWEGKEVFHLQEGLSYEVNNRIPHGGTNKGTADRIHLIFDYFPVTLAGKTDKASLYDRHKWPIFHAIKSAITGLVRRPM